MTHTHTYSYTVALEWGILQPTHYSAVLLLSVVLLTVTDKHSSKDSDPASNLTNEQRASKRLHKADGKTAES